MSKFVSEHFEMYNWLPIVLSIPIEMTKKEETLSQKMFTIDVASNMVCNVYSAQAFKYPAQIPYVKMSAKDSSIF